MIRRLSLLTVAGLVPTPHLAEAKPAGNDLVCVPPANQTSSQAVCQWTKELSTQCSAQAPESIFSQCNVFNLNLNRDGTRSDDAGNQYVSATFKFSETNECSTGKTGGLFSLVSKCDTFAAYAQIFRNTSNQKCYAMVNSALLGTQLMEHGIRNNPNKQITKVEIPGVSRRIIFTPSNDSRILKQRNASLIRTKDKKRTFTPSGQAISALYLLELESTLTTKKENLRTNPSKIRISRGLQQESKDFFDITLNRGQGKALNAVLEGCG
jgi:hypothetical protein